MPAVQPAVPGRAGWAPGFRQSWDWGQMQQGGEGGGTPGDDARTANCVSAERAFASLVSLKPPCLFGGEGSVVQALLLNNYPGLCFWKEDSVQTIKI